MKLESVSFSLPTEIFIEKSVLRVDNTTNEERNSINSFNWARLLQACGISRNLPTGKLVFSYILRNGYEWDWFLSNLAVDMFGKCGAVGFAETIFQRMCHKNVFSWNNMIRAYSQNGHIRLAMEVFWKMKESGMVKPNKVTFVNILASNSNSGDLSESKLLHAYILQSGIERDICINTSLVTRYGKSGDLEFARNIFELMPLLNVISWTAMIAAYAYNGRYSEALLLFVTMQLHGVPPNKLTFVSILNIADLPYGKKIHACILANDFEADVIVATALVNMYASRGSFGIARLVFERIHEKDVISWTAMISGYSQAEHGQEALNIFKQMQVQGMKPNSFTLVSMLNASAELASLARGKHMHSHVLDDPSLVVNNAVISMYGKCKDENSAWIVFERIEELNLVTWNATIAAYAQNGCPIKALELFQGMKHDSWEPNLPSFVSVLDSCAILAMKELGKQLHDEIKSAGCESNVLIGTALINMYGKCGDILNAYIVFNDMPEKDVVTWNTMITVYGQNGHGKEAFQLFSRIHLHEVVPNMSTMLNIISACSHAGLVEEGFYQFLSIGCFSLTPTMEYYGSLIDLLGRSGCLDISEGLVDVLPFILTSTMWTTLLGSCTAVDVD